MKRQCIGSLGKLDQNGIVGTFVTVVLGQFDPQASCLYTDRGITLGIESHRPAQDFGRNLVLLQRNTRVIKRVLGEIAEQLAQGFGGVEAMTFNKSIYLLEALYPADCE